MNQFTNIIRTYVCAYGGSWRLWNKTCAHTWPLGSVLYESQPPIPHVCTYLCIKTFSLVSCLKKKEKNITVVIDLHEVDLALAFLPPRPKEKEKINILQRYAFLQKAFKKNCSKTLAFNFQTKMFLKKGKYLGCIRMKTFCCFLLQ